MSGEEIFGPLEGQDPSEVHLMLYNDPAPLVSIVEQHPLIAPLNDALGLYLDQEKWAQQYPEFDKFNDEWYLDGNNKITLDAYFNFSHYRGYSFIY